MKIAKTLISSVILACLAAPALAQGGTVYQAGTETSEGQTVNVYTNVGAQRYHRAMQSSGGVIHNTAPKDDPAFSSAANMPKAFSYDESGYRGGARYINGADLAALIDREGKKNGVDPLLLEIIIKHESNFNPNAVSPTGALGLMQLMPGTAANCGVKDPLNPAENVAGGAYYFAQQLRRFQDLGQALAAYNAGPGAVQTYGGIPPFAETQNYVASICSEYANRRKKAAPKTESSKSESSKSDSSKAD